MNRSLDYILLDVFTQTPFRGNPLAVVPEAEGLTEAQMQTIAGEFNLSETVFFLPPQDPKAAIRARIFTPRRELPFAGHPTVGAACVLRSRMSLPPEFSIEEGVGLVPIQCSVDASGSERAWLTTPPVSFFEELERTFCARLLGLNEEDLDTAAAPQFISAGSPFLCICLASPEAVDRAALQQQYLSQALGSVNSVGTFLFASKQRDSKENFDVYARMFAPQTGIAEDPATGGATGPLAAYMMKYGLLPNTQPAKFVSEQGAKMGRQSLLFVRTDPRAGTIEVGGNAVIIGKGSLFLS